LAAGLHPDPIGELKRSPDPLAAIRGPRPTSKGREEREHEREGREREEGKRREGKGLVLPHDFFARRPWFTRSRYLRPVNL